MLFTKAVEYTVPRKKKIFTGDPEIVPILVQIEILLFKKSLYSRTFLVLKPRFGENQFSNCIFSENLIFLMHILFGLVMRFNVFDK